MKNDEDKPSMFNTFLSKIVGAFSKRDVSEKLTDQIFKNLRGSGDPSKEANNSEEQSVRNKFVKAIKKERIVAKFKKHEL